MALKSVAKSMANTLLGFAGAQIVRRIEGSRHSGLGVDERDRQTLRPDSPDLLSLIDRYRGVHGAFGETPVWNPQYISPEDLVFFRGDNGYVWQWQDKNQHSNYLLTYLYLKKQDHLGVLDMLKEDADYGVFTFQTGEYDSAGQERLISRDLLDSANEILFLDRVLGIAKKPLTLLDIGAGYGRLAYRMTSAICTNQYYLIDGIAQSTFLSCYYLKRKNATRCTVIPLDQQERLPDNGGIDLAINIHSFSECSMQTVEYWVGRCAELRIKYLFIVPNESASGGDELRLNDGRSFNPILSMHRYEIFHSEPKYANSAVQKCGVSPAWYYLYRLRADSA